MQEMDRPTVQSTEPAKPQGAVVTVGGVVIGAAFVLFGAWMVWGERGLGSRNAKNDSTQDADRKGLISRFLGWKARSSVPTVVTIGLCSLIWGYHMIAWSLESERLRAFIPVHWWWASGLGLALLITMSRLVDRLETRGGEK